MQRPKHDCATVLLLQQSADYTVVQKFCCKPQPGNLVIWR